LQRKIAGKIRISKIIERIKWKNFVSKAINLFIKK